MLPVVKPMHLELQRASIFAHEYVRIVEVMDRSVYSTYSSGMPSGAWSEIMGVGFGYPLVSFHRGICVAHYQISVPQGLTEQIQIDGCGSGVGCP